MTVNAADLDHPAVRLLHPSMWIELRHADCHVVQVERWLEQGGQEQLVQLRMYCNLHPCNNLLVRLQGLRMLRFLDITYADL